MAINLSKANNDVLVKVGKGIAHNAPKSTPLHAACLNIAILTATGTPNLVKLANARYKGPFTPMGHQMNSKGAAIDLCLCSGKAYTAQHFIDAQINHAGGYCKKTANDMATFKQHNAPFDVISAWFAQKAIDHIKWCMNTANNSHKGFGDRLGNMSLAEKHAEIAKHYEIVWHELSNQFAIKYQGHIKTARAIMNK